MSKKSLKNLLYQNINKRNLEDYNFLKSIFTDKEVTKTASVFAGQNPKTDADLNLFIDNAVEDDVKSRYGLKILFCSEVGKKIGCSGLLRNKINPKVLEGAIYLKPEFFGSGYGKLILEKFKADADLKNEIYICSVWNKNKASLNLVEKVGFEFVKQIKKEYYGNKMMVNIYRLGTNNDDKFDMEKTLITNIKTLI